MRKFGIAAPGICQNGVIIKAENLGISHFEIVKELKEQLQYEKISLQNDGKCAALCEKQYGGLKESEDAIFLCLGTGIGGAVFMEGKMLRAQKTEGFEFGHMVIHKNGLACKCGSYGCFENYASMRALKEKVRKQEKLEKITGKELYRLLQYKSKEIENVVEEWLEDLKIGLVNLINIFEPEVICIGGSFAYFEDILLEKLKNKMSQNNQTFSKNLPQIVTAECRNDAGMIGATCAKRDGEF